MLDKNLTLTLLYLLESLACSRPALFAAFLHLNPTSLTDWISSTSNLMIKMQRLYLRDKDCFNQFFSLSKILVTSEDLLDYHISTTVLLRPSISNLHILSLISVTGIDLLMADATTLLKVAKLSSTRALRLTQLAEVQEIRRIPSAVAET